jgi:hypothetical protein
MCRPPREEFRDPLDMRCMRKHPIRARYRGSCTFRRLFHRTDDKMRRGEDQTRRVEREDRDSRRMYRASTRENRS